MAYYSHGRTMRISVTINTSNLACSFYKNLYPRCKDVVSVPQGSILSIIEVYKAIGERVHQYLIQRPRNVSSTARGMMDGA